MQTLSVTEGLARIRKRRWFLWAIIWTYLPAIWLTLRTTRSNAATAVTFGVWIGLASVAASAAAFTRCPRCGNYYHMKGLVPVWVRKCLHCELGLTEDKRKQGSKT